MTPSGTVLLERRGAVAWIRLNRPDQLNALDSEMRHRLGDVLTEVEQDGTSRVVVLTGAGRAFCAGGDLSEFKAQLLAGDHGPLTEAVAVGGAVFRRFETSPLPVIAAVNGVAVAGGLELIMCCDVVIAARSAKIGDGHLKFGVLPGGGGAIRLPRRIPANVAKRLLLTGELLPAEDYIKWGLVNEVVDPAALEDTVSKLAQHMAGLSPLGLAAVKRLANLAPDMDMSAALLEEFDAFRTYAASADFLEGVSAFADRRAPVFTGR